MDHTIDYYLAPQSPWVYLGHARLHQLARAAGAKLRVMPVDLGGKVFPISGGLPLGQRAPQRSLGGISNQLYWCGFGIKTRRDV